MDLNVNGRFVRKLDVTPEMTIREFKNLVRSSLVEGNFLPLWHSPFRIEVFFADNQQLSPDVLSANNYDTYTFETQRNNLIGGRVLVNTASQTRPDYQSLQQVPQPIYQPQVPQPIYQPQVPQVFSGQPVEALFNEFANYRQPQVYQQPMLPGQQVYQQPLPERERRQRPVREYPNMQEIRREVNETVAGTDYQPSFHFINKEDKTVFASIRLNDEDMIEIDDNILLVLNRIRNNPYLRNLGVQSAISTPINFLQDEDGDEEFELGVGDDSFHHEMFIWIYKYN